MGIINYSFLLYITGISLSSAKYLQEHPHLYTSALSGRALQPSFHPRGFSGGQKFNLLLSLLAQGRHLPNNPEDAKWRGGDTNSCCQMSGTR